MHGIHVSFFKNQYSFTVSFLLARGGGGGGVRWEGGGGGLGGRGGGGAQEFIGAGSLSHLLLLCKCTTRQNRGWLYWFVLHNAKKLIINNGNMYSVYYCLC